MRKVNETREAIIFLGFYVLASMAEFTLWVRLWNVMTPKLCWGIYIASSFVLAIACWCILGPPGRKNDGGADEFRYIMFFVFMFIWPIGLFMVDVMAFFVLVIAAAERIADDIRKLLGVE